MTIRENIENKAAWESLSVDKRNRHKFITYDFEGDKQSIVLLGDEHIGSKYYDSETHESWLQWCYDTETPIILMGDILETSTRDSIGAGIFEQDEIVQEQLEHAVNLYRPLAEKNLIFGNHVGNHEARVFKHSGTNLSKIFAQMLEIPYLGIGAVHYFRINDQRYTCYTTHGSSGARLPHTKIKAALDLANMIDVDIYCFDEETELMTCNGFKKINELKKNEEIYNFNVEKKVIQKDKIKDIIRKKGKTMILKNRFLEMEVTPEHRVLYQTCTKKGNMFFKTAEKISKETGQIKIPCSGNTENKEYKISDELISLVGWIISEGHFKNEKNAKKAIGIYQSVKNKEKCEIIRYLLNKLKIKFTEKVSNDCISFYIWARDGEKIRKFVSEKNIPDWCFKLNERQFELLLNAMVLGDGYWQNKSSGQYYSKNKDLIEKLQLLLTLNGYRSIMKGRVGGYSNNLNFEISFHKKKTFTIPLSRINFKNQNKIKKVWCVATKNGTVIVRKKGRVFISGNCMGHLHTLDHHVRNFYRPNLRNKNIEEAEKHFVITGSFLKHWGSYAHVKGLEPSRVGAVRMKLNGLERRIKISMG